MAFPFLTIFMIFIVWLSYKLNKSKKATAKETEDFWAREMKANSTLSKDIDNLSYINIPLEKFPLDFTSDAEVVEIENQIKELSTHKLLNLTGMTNTDLKLEYGVLNFQTMSQVSEDFDRLIVLLNSYANKLIEFNKPSDAQKVLEYSIGIGSDISESYIQLAKLYLDQENDTKLDYLLQQLENSNLLMKSSIINKITNLKSA